MYVICLEGEKFLFEAIKRLPLHAVFAKLHGEVCNPGHGAEEHNRIKRNCCTAAHCRLQ